MIPFPRSLANRATLATWGAALLGCVLAAGLWVPPARAADLWPAPRLAQLSPADQRTTTPPLPTTEVTPPQSPPSTPPASPAAPGEPTPPVTAPWPPAPGAEQAVVGADSTRYEAGKILATGNVLVKIPHLTLRAASASLDEKQEWGEFTDASLEGQYYRVTAQRLRVNLNTEQFELFRGRATIEPSYFASGLLLAPVFVRGREVTGTPKGPIQAAGGAFTTCDLLHPHYDLRSSKVTVLPGRWVRLRRPSLYLWGTRVFQYPFNLTLSMDQNENRFFPELGQSDVEGYYAKLAFLYLAGKAGQGFARLQMTQKRGVGLGLDHTINNARQQGTLSLFYEPQEGSFSARAEDRYKLSPSLESDFTTSYQNNTGYSGNSSTLSSNLTFTREVGTTRTQLGLARSTATSSYSDSSTMTTTLRHDQGPQDSRWSLRATMRDSSSATDQPTDEELQTELRWTRRMSALDVEAYLTDRFDLDRENYTGDSSRFFLNRVPEVTLRTDNTRMGLLNLFGGTPTKLAVYLGRYLQDPDNLSVYRAAAETTVGGDLHRLWGGATLRPQVQFRQAFYDDGSAQYAVNVFSELRQRFGERWDSRLTYNYATTQGFAPIRLDYSGRRHDLAWQAVRVTPGRSRLELSTGFDLFSNIWRDALLKYELMTGVRSKLQLQTGYALETARWRPAALRWIDAPSDDFHLNLGANYDIAASQLTRVTGEVDWRLNRLWRLQTLAGFNGYSNEFDTWDVQLTRDLHCWVATLSYDKSLGELRLNLGLKAFPSNERTMGIGRTGSQFESSFGGMY